MLKSVKITIRQNWYAVAVQTLQERKCVQNTEPIFWSINAAIVVPLLSSFVLGRLISAIRVTMISRESLIYLRTNYRSVQQVFLIQLKVQILSTSLPAYSTIGNMIDSLSNNRNKGFSWSVSSCFSNCSYCSYSY